MGWPIQGPVYISFFVCCLQSKFKMKHRACTFGEDTIPVPSLASAGSRIIRTLQDLASVFIPAEVFR